MVGEVSMYSASLDARLRATLRHRRLGREEPDQIHALGEFMCLREGVDLWGDAGVQWHTFFENLLRKELWTGCLPGLSQQLISYVHVSICVHTCLCVPSMNTYRKRALVSAETWQAFPALAQPPFS